MTIRVLIADDHGVVAEGLRGLVEAQTDMKVIGLVEDGREAVRRAMESSPDVVLMDIGMPVLNGTEATRIIRERRPQTRVIMLSLARKPGETSRTRSMEKLYIRDSASLIRFAIQQGVTPLE